MQKALLFALPLLLAACVSSEQIHLPTGQAVNKLTCSMTSESLSRCYQAAGEICGGRGYTAYYWDGTPWGKPYPAPSEVDNYTMLGSTTLLMACHSERRQG